MRIFKNHDKHLDNCRSFLVFSMIFTHVFEMFYLPDYNRNFTYFVTIGFVLLSGFSIGALYTNIIAKAPKEVFKKMIVRALKLIVLFIVCNIIIVTTHNDKWNFLLDRDYIEIIISILIGSDQNIFGFDILIPIALTAFFSHFILLISVRSSNTIGLIAFMILLIALEMFEICNYYGIMIVLAGLFGCVLGQIAYQLDWDVFIQNMSKAFPLIGTGLLISLYYVAIFYFTEKGYKVKIGYHVIPTATLLFFVYIVSAKYYLGNRKAIDSLNKYLSRFMLFAYLFHILVINFLYFVIPKDSLGGLECIFVGVGVLSITIFACRCISYFSYKYVFFAKIYNVVFKL